VIAGIAHHFHRHSSLQGELGVSMPEIVKTDPPNAGSLDDPLERLAHNNYHSSGSRSLGAALRIARRRAPPSAAFNRYADLASVFDVR